MDIMNYFFPGIEIIVIGTLIIIACLSPKGKILVGIGWGVLSLALGIVGLGISISMMLTYGYSGGSSFSFPLLVILLVTIIPGYFFSKFCARKVPKAWPSFGLLFALPLFVFGIGIQFDEQTPDSYAKTIWGLGGVLIMSISIAGAYVGYKNLKP